jgi:MYXO-CTERM domain-containing protein
MARITAFWAACVLAPLGVLVEGSALASPPVSSGAVPLRPSVHIDRYGRTLEDVCPELTPGGRRCFAQRVVPPGRKPRIRPFGGGGSECESEGGGGGSSPPSGTMSASDVPTAYNIPASSSAGGKIVALVELPSTHAFDDVNAYRSQYGIAPLPACPTDSSGVPSPGGTACFARVGEDGTVNSVSSSDCAGWSGETGLDMDMVSAACPDCSIVLVEANNTNDLDAMNTIAATVVHASAVSNSWGAPESGSDDQSPYSSSGILTLAASGDSGYLNEGEGADAANFPASSIYVLAVGGTTLSSSGGQVVWNDGSQGGAGGSGCSQEFSTPSWQSGSGFNFGGCSMRASVDLAAAAEFEPSGEGGGIAAYDADDGGWNAVVGTSAASPTVAAIMVRIGLGGADQHALLYSHISDFNDVTSGNNSLGGSCSGDLCEAASGWDGPTGLGTPNATSLATLSTSSPPPPPPPTDGGSTPPTPDGGVTPPSKDGGSTPPSDDGGTGLPSGSDGGSGGLGGLCSGPSECDSHLCVSPGSGQSGVCSQSCSTTSCPDGFTCNAGYCFAAGGSSGDAPGGEGSGGCSAASSSSSSSPWSGAGWVLLGLLAVAKRRRAP